MLKAFENIIVGEIFASYVPAPAEEEVPGLSEATWPYDIMDDAD